MSGTDQAAVEEVKVEEAQCEEHCFRICTNKGDWYSNEDKKWRCDACLKMIQQLFYDHPECFEDSESEQINNH